MIAAGAIVRGRTLALACLALVVAFLLLPAVSGQALGRKRVSLDFEVVDSDTGHPIPGASVQVYDAFDRGYEGAEPPVEATAGQDGRARLVNKFRACGPEILGHWFPTVFYFPWVVEAKAPGYTPLLASLSGENPLNSSTQHGK